MKWIDKKKLKKLFENSIFNDPVWDICLEYFKKNGLKKFVTTEKILTTEVIETYKRRYEFSVNGKKIAGIKRLIPDLHNFRESHLKIHAFGKPDQTFVVFTDVKVKLVLGIIITGKFQET
jgi:hypothetical protein